MQDKTAGNFYWNKCMTGLTLFHKHLILKFIETFYRCPLSCKTRQIGIGTVFDFCFNVYNQFILHFFLSSKQEILNIQREKGFYKQQNKK